MTLQELWASVTTTASAWAHQVWTADLSKIGSIAMIVLAPLALFVVLMLPLRTDRYGGWVARHRGMQLAHIVGASVIAWILMKALSAR
jgi:hypothetical protein